MSFAVASGSPFCLISFLNSGKLYFGSFGRQPDSFRLHVVVGAVYLRFLDPGGLVGFDDAGTWGSGRAGRCEGGGPLEPVSATHGL